MDAELHTVVEWKLWTKRLGIVALAGCSLVHFVHGVFGYQGYPVYPGFGKFDLFLSPRIAEVTAAHFTIFDGPCSFTQWLTKPLF